MAALLDFRLDCSLAAAGVNPASIFAHVRLKVAFRFWFSGQVATRFKGLMYNLQRWLMQSHKATKFTIDGVILTL